MLEKENTGGEAGAAGVSVLVSGARTLGGRGCVAYGIQNTPSLVGLHVLLKLHILCVLNRGCFTLGLCK